MMSDWKYKHHIFVAAVIGGLVSVVWLLKLPKLLLEMSLTFID